MIDDESELEDYLSVDRYVEDRPIKDWRDEPATDEDPDEEED